MDYLVWYQNMNKVSIVIPNYNRYDLVHQLLFDIYKNCSPVHEVIVVNDGCTEEESFTGLIWWQQTKMLPVKQLDLEDNVGFLLASNAGMKKATGDIVALISNDVRIKDDIVSLISHNLSVSPNSLVGGRILGFDTGWNSFGDKMFPYLEGWLLAARKESWEEFGYFDERYVPHDFEDVDISTTAANLGYNFVALPEESTYHAGAQTIKYGDEREKQTKRNKEKFRKKWKLP